VFAFGLIAFELLTGSYPFAGSAAAAVLAGRRPPALGQNEELGESVAELLRSCLDLDPAKRPAAAELARVLAGAGAMPIAVTPPASGGRRRTTA
jgi:serine/threonine protein kinase